MQWQQATIDYLAFCSTRLFFQEKKTNRPAILEFPIGPFKSLVPQDPDIGEFYVVQERRVTDFQAPKL